MSNTDKPISPTTPPQGGTTKPKRRRSGTAEWHMSREAVSLSVPQVFAWTDRECLNFLVEVRFGSWNTVGCPHCGTTGKHYWRPLQKRWKCAGCGSTFSVTSGTVFASRKLPLQSIIAGTLLWLNSAAGQPALELKRHLNVTYNTAYTLQHKLREALVRGYNQGPLAGDLEMDGAHQSGRRAAEKRGRPQGSRPVTSETPVEELSSILTQAGKQKAKRKGPPKGAIDPEFGKRLPEDRRIVMVVRQRSGKKGKGANGTRVAIAMAETATEAEGILATYAAIPESYLNTDSSPAYASIGKAFLAHRTVEHAKELSGPNGENNNQAEEYNWRYDRAEKGIYLNVEPKYMLDYACEIAFRSDTRRLPNGQQLRLALNVATSVGESQFWRGFTRGRHRENELLHAGPRPARSSGPAKGRVSNGMASPR